MAPTRYAEYQGKTYLVSDLLKAASSLPVEEVELPNLPGIEEIFETWPWDEGWTLREFIQHLTRTQDADMNSPILLAPDGAVLDGYHRICKAAVTGEETLKVVRLIFMPKPTEKLLS